MNYLSVENISKSYPDKNLFTDISFGLNKGEKVALIARNGVGKSTLLKILAAKETPDKGKVIVRKGIKIGFLEQDPDFNKPITIKDYINESNSNIFSIIRNYKKSLEDQSKNHTEETHTRFEAASLLMDQYHAWDYERKLSEMLTRFNISDLDQRIDNLSGGMKKRFSLALILLDSPDILLFDEPTNHLDIEMIEWMEKYLSFSNITLLVVTHDRYFLDNVCNRIFELHRGRIIPYNGNYSYFLEKSALREDIEKAETDKARQLMKKELEWFRRSPQARTTKSKARIQSLEEIKQKATGYQSDKTISLNIKMSRVGGKILEIEKIVKKYGDTLIVDGFNYIFKKGERIGIIGKNGTGKTSFLNLLTGIEKPDNGAIVKGDTTVFGYYTQAGLIADENKKVIDIVKDIAEVITTGNGSVLTAAQFLHYFLFSAEMQHTLVSKLSGGEKRRLLLLTVLMKNPNFLIMDEPTNDLDINTLNRLEEFLSDYKGSLILVSHDRYFLDRLVDHLFIFEGNGVIRDHYGTYSDYKINFEQNQSQKEREQHLNKKVDKNLNTSIAAKGKTKLTYQEKIEMENLEKEISLIEREIGELEKKINDGILDYVGLEKTSLRISELMQLSETKTLRWIDLASFIK